MLSIVIKACWILGGPSRIAAEKFFVPRDAKIVANSVVFNLQMWLIETAEEILNTSFV
jgi:hypothetical protein